MTTGSGMAVAVSVPKLKMKSYLMERRARRSLSPCSSIFCFFGSKPLRFLRGWAAVGLTLFLAGSGMTAGRAFSYTLDGIASRSFAAPLAEVRVATLTALDRLGIEVEAKLKTDMGEMIKATGADGDIEIEIEAVGPKITRVQAVAKQGVSKDQATAAQIIQQTEKALNGTLSGEVREMTLDESVVLAFPPRFK